MPQLRSSSIKECASHLSLSETPTNNPVKSKWTSSITASFLMGAALSSHFFGYECARAASISLLASKDIGLGTEALTYTVAVGSPAGAVVLYLYARSIKLVGPQSTLRISEAMCIFHMLVLVVLFNYGYINGYTGGILVVCYYSFREIYVSLLSTQYWSFIASVLDTRKSGNLVSIAGSVSVSSALGGCAVEYLVHWFGVSGLLVTSLAATVMSTAFSEMAYSIAESDADGRARLHKDRPPRVSADGTPLPKRNNIWIEFWHIMYRSNTLRLLYVEAVCHQLVTNTLNLMFHEALRENIADNAARAVAVGRFFASVNVASCTLQIFVLPSILSTATLPQVLRGMPALLLFTTVLGYLKPSITAIMISFGTMKVLEYSIMTAAGEMIYMPMSHDDRYLGKEVIRFFGHKLGKSWSSLVLTSAVSRLNPSTSFMSMWATGATLVWSCATQVLSTHLIDREEVLKKETTALEKKQKEQLEDESVSCTTSESAESTDALVTECDNEGDSTSAPVPVPVPVPVPQEGTASPRDRDWYMGDAPVEEVEGGTGRDRGAGAGAGVVKNDSRSIGLRRRKHVKESVLVDSDEIVESVAETVGNGTSSHQHRHGRHRHHRKTNDHLSEQIAVTDAQSNSSQSESNSISLGERVRSGSSGFLVRIGSALVSLSQLGEAQSNLQQPNTPTRHPTSRRNPFGSNERLPSVKE